MTLRVLAIGDLSNNIVMFKKFVQSSKPLVLVLQKLIFNSLIVFTTSGEFHQLRGFNHILLMCSAASLAFLKQILFLETSIEPEQKIVNN